MPITEALADVLFNGKSAKEAVSKLMTRPSKSENESDFLS